MESPIRMVCTGRKSFCVLLVLHLAIATFMVAALPDVCFCGQACPHDLCEKAKKGDNRTQHQRCHDPDCRSCAVEKMVSLDSQVLHNTSYKKKSYVPSHIVVVSSDHLSDNHPLENFYPNYPVYCSAGIYPPPIYLRNIPLLI